MFSKSNKNTEYYLKYLIDDSNLNLQNNEGNSCLHYLCSYNLWKTFKSQLVNPISRYGLSFLKP